MHVLMHGMALKAAEALTVLQPCRHGIGEKMATPARECALEKKWWQALRIAAG
jgi:hypothetical protein